jgi:hypothetical protein
MRFEEVANDSRCPIDAICVSAGDAVVIITVADELGSSRYELHTSITGSRSVSHRSLSVEIVELQPYPLSSRRTEPSAYRATFKVTAA